MYEIAKENIEKAGEITNRQDINKVNMYLGDALEILKGKKIDIKNKEVRILENTYDLIFIDANKSKYLEYFEICKNLLNEEGIIFLDNVLFAGYVLRRIQ